VGYGESPIILLRNYLILALAIFPVLFYVIRDHLAKTPASSIRPLDALLFSLETILAPGIHSGISPASVLAQFLVGLESLTGLVAAGLFVSLLFSWISDK